MSTLQQTLALLQGGVDKESERLRAMMGQPANRKFVNPGQGAMESLRNPDGNQARAMLAASLEMMGHDPRTMPGQTINRAMTRGMGELDQGRGMDREQQIQQQALALRQAEGGRDFFGGMYKASAGTQAPANVREYQFFSGLSPEEQKQYMTMKRTGQIVDLGGGGIGYQGADGQMRVLVQPETATGRDANRTGAMTTAEGTAKTGTEQVDTGIAQTWAASEAYAMGESMANTAEEYLAMLDSGQLDTGPLNGMLYNWFGVGTEELAVMNADQIDQVLKNLQIVNLAPVTEKEMANVMKLWADVAKQETPNRGLLKRTIEKSKRVMEMAKRDAAVAAGRVQTYGGDAQFNNVVRSNPFLQTIYGSGGSGGVDLSGMPD